LFHNKIFAKNNPVIDRIKRFTGEKAPVLRIIPAEINKQIRAIKTRRPPIIVFPCDFLGFSSELSMKLLGSNGLDMFSS